MCISGPGLTSVSTSRRIVRRSTPRFLSTLDPTPEPSITSPRRMCSVPMYPWLRRFASALAFDMTERARSVNRSNIEPIVRAPALRLGRLRGLGLERLLGLGQAGACRGDGPVLARLFPDNHDTLEQRARWLAIGSGQAAD